MKGSSFVPVATLLAAAILLAGCATPPASSQGGLARIAETKTVTFGYREDARPFSYVGTDGKPDGYSVELCRRVADSLKGQLGLTQLDVRWQPVTVATRQQAVVDGRVDIECGSTSRTFGREKQVDFSNPTWVEGASFVALPASGIRLAKDLNGKRVGVIPGTTTEAALKHLATRGITPAFVTVATHTDGIAAVRDGRAEAYATDRLILVGETLGGPDGQTLRLGDEFLSFESYGLMMRRDPDLRLAVNKALAGVYRSGEVETLMRSIFGPDASPTPMLRAAFVLSALPD